MLKFYNIPLLTAGGFAKDFTEPKRMEDSDYYLLTKTGFSYNDTLKIITKFFDRYARLYVCFC